MHNRRDVANAAGFGGKPQPREIQLRSWKRLNKSSLIGIANITSPVGNAMLDIDDCPC
jgi:hypothetical protein